MIARLARQSILERRRRLDRGTMSARRLGVVASMLLIAACGADDGARSVERPASSSMVDDTAPATTATPTPDESVPPETVPGTIPETIPEAVSEASTSRESSTVPAPESTAAPQPSGSSPDQSTGLVPLPPVVAPTPITAAPSSGGFALDPALPLVVAAVTDLAGRLGIATGDVTVVEARAVTWGDSSLGCPQPGMMYLPRVVDGALVVLGAGGRTYEYHGGSPLQLCEHPKASAVPGD